MYQPNEPVRGKYLVSMQEQIDENIVDIQSRLQQREAVAVTEDSGVIERNLSRFSFFTTQTDQSVFSDIISIQPNFLG